MTYGIGIQFLSDDPILCGINLYDNQFETGTNGFIVAIFEIYLWQKKAKQFLCLNESIHPFFIRTSKFFLSLNVLIFKAI